MHLLSYWDGWSRLWTDGLGWLWLPLLMILFCVILCVIAMFLWKGMWFLWDRMCGSGACMPWGRGSQTRGGEAPLDIAKRRYALGEITKEQYEDIKRTLG